MKKEFYDVAFRKKLYKDLESLQKDADQWINMYNTQRPHSGRFCFGKTPMAPFQESKSLARSKIIPLNENLSDTSSDNFLLV